MDSYGYKSKSISYAQSIYAYTHRRSVIALQQQVQVSSNIICIGGFPCWTKEGSGLEMTDYGFGSLRGQGDST
jgi:hypothetical protein